VDLIISLLWFILKGSDADPKGFVSDPDPTFQVISGPVLTSSFLVNSSTGSVSFSDQADQWRPGTGALDLRLTGGLLHTVPIKESTSEHIYFQRIAGDVRGAWTCRSLADPEFWSRNAPCEGRHLDYLSLRTASESFFKFLFDRVADPLLFYTCFLGSSNKCVGQYS